MPLTRKNVRAKLVRRSLSRNGFIAGYMAPPRGPGLTPGRIARGARQIATLAALRVLLLFVLRVSDLA